MRQLQKQKCQQDLCCLYVTVLLMFLLCMPIGASINTEKPLLLPEGSTAVIPFYQEWPPDDSLHPYFALSLGHANDPFCSNGIIDPQGLSSETQFQRFAVSAVKTDRSLFINLTIQSVCNEDEGIYIATVVLFGNHHPLIQQKHVRVRSKAECFFTASTYLDRFKEAHCHAIASDNDVTLSCFQDTTKIPHMDAIYKEGDRVRGVFWVMFSTPVSCCSHGNGKMISEEECSDFIWPPPTVEGKQTVPTMHMPASNDVMNVPSTAVWSRSVSTHQFNNKHCFLCLFLQIIIASVMLGLRD